MEQPKLFDDTPYYVEPTLKQHAEQAREIIAEWPEWKKKTEIGRPSYEKFVKQAIKEVSTWPEWQQRMLGGQVVQMDVYDCIEESQQPDEAVKVMI